MRKEAELTRAEETIRRKQQQMQKRVSLVCVCVYVCVCAVNAETTHVYNLLFSVL